MRVTGNKSEREEQAEEGKRRDEAEGGRREKRHNDLARCSSKIGGTERGGLESKKIEEEAIRREEQTYERRRNGRSEERMRMERERMTTSEAKRTERENLASRRATQISSILSRSRRDVAFHPTGRTFRFAKNSLGDSSPHSACMNTTTRFDRVENLTVSEGERLCVRPFSVDSDGPSE